MYRVMVLVFYHTDCELKMVRKDMLEELIVNAIVDELSKKPIMDDMVAEHLKQQDSRIISKTTVMVQLRL